VRAGRSRRRENRPRDGLSKLNSVERRGRRCSRRARASDDRSHQTSRAPAGVRAPASLERR